MSDENKKVTLGDVVTPKNIQEYILGTKKNGQPRAVYDIVKDFMIDKPKKKKKHKKKKGNGASIGVFPDNMSVYNEYRKHKKKGKHKKKYWHI